MADRHSHVKLILGVVIALLAGLVFLVIAEPLVPSESVPGPVYVLRGARGRMGRAGRYWQISRILARRGLLPYAEAHRAGKRPQFGGGGGALAAIAAARRSLSPRLRGGGGSFP
ncbi:MAG: hypothetical protein ACRDOE_07725 [Streptosporangiaceae bacterium]